MNLQHKGNEYLKVFISNRESICDKCGENPYARKWKGSWNLVEIAR